MNRFSIADRILSEYEKHRRLPDNAWAHMAAAKIIAQIREEDQAELDKPAAGLTVEEVMRELTAVTAPPEVRVAVIRGQFRARLEAALKAKQQ